MVQLNEQTNTLLDTLAPMRETMQSQMNLKVSTKKEKKIRFSSNESFGFRYLDNRVNTVYPTSQASKARVPEGWYMKTINGRKLSNDHRQVKEILARAKEEES